MLAVDRSAAGAQQRCGQAATTASVASNAILRNFILLLLRYGWRRRQPSALSRSPPASSAMIFPHPAGRSAAEPLGHGLAEVRRRLRVHACGEVGEGVRGQHLAHSRLGLQHDCVY